MGWIKTQKEASGSLNNLPIFSFWENGKAHHCQGEVLPHIGAASISLRGCVCGGGTEVLMLTEKHQGHLEC